jgi:bacteriocin-like protein
MQRLNEKAIAMTELTDEDLDHVVGGTKVLTTATVIPGTIESGAETDPNIGTHTQLWVTTTVIK